jgi:hypothetical protein
MRTYWYDILKATTHELLAQAINEAAEQGWEPTQCWSDKSGNPMMGQYATDHFCLVRMPVNAPEGARS